MPSRRKHRPNPGMGNNDTRFPKKPLKHIWSEGLMGFEMLIRAGIGSHLRDDPFGESGHKPIHRGHETRKRQLRTDRHQDHSTAPL